MEFDGVFTSAVCVVEEESAMAVVLCAGKLLTTNEEVYGVPRLSLPKGHLEKNETALEAAIRECFEEANVQLHKADLVRPLTPYSYEFTTPENRVIRKTITPYLFEVQDFGAPMAKEERMLGVQWMDAAEFLAKCSYDNVRIVVREALLD